MTHLLKPRRFELYGESYLDLEPDPEMPHRYLVRFCGFDRDRNAQAATEHARVRLMMASLRGQAPYPYPLPPRLVIGSLDAEGWHAGKSGYSQAVASMPLVSKVIAQLEGDLMLRVALTAARGPTSEPRSG